MASTSDLQDFTRRTICGQGGLPMAAMLGQGGLPMAAMLGQGDYLWHPCLVRRGPSVAATLGPGGPIMGGPSEHRKNSQPSGDLNPRLIYL